MLVSDKNPVVSPLDESVETKRTDSGEIHCFQSVGGKATVFLESLPTFTSVKHVTHIDYALEPLDSEFHTSRQDGEYYVCLLELTSLFVCFFVCLFVCFCFCFCFLFVLFGYVSEAKALFNHKREM